MKRILHLIAFVFLFGALQAQGHSKPELSVFPNPATEFISVQDKNDLVGFVHVISLSGRRVKEFEYSKGEHCSVTDLPKGMYLVQILDRQKRIMTTQKMDKR